MLSNYIANIFKQAITAAIAAGELGELSAAPDEIAVEYPKNPEHGDRAISIAMKLTKEAKIPPRAVAEAIVKHLDRSSFIAVDIAGPGFINLRLSWQALGVALAELHKQGDSYGRLPARSGSKTLVEYVSTNPTGDLHIGHGRQAVYGSALVSLLKWAGYEVSSEFYINDAGAQMMKLGESVKATVLIAEGLMQESVYPEGGYPLDSMREFIYAQNYVPRLPPPVDLDKLSIEGKRASLEKISINDYAILGKEIFLAAQKELLTDIGVEFDSWFSENKELYGTQGANPSEPCAVIQLCDLLTQAGFTYEADAALWLRATDLGDERDRVLRKGDGYYTYIAGDLAYHCNKLRRGYDSLINILGADHHGQEPSLVAGLQALVKAGALNFSREQLEVALIQMVSLQKGGVEYKMSKRAGNLVTVRELYKEVGRDAMRYFLAESQITNHMTFDLELATKKDKDNPVYYVQYAHARCCSILRTIIGEQINIGDAVTAPRQEPPRLSQIELDTMLAEFNSNTGLYDCFSALDGDAASSTRKLVLNLLAFPEEVAAAAVARAPYKIANYLRELAGLYHQFYSHNRVLVDDAVLMRARVSIVVATRIVLANALSLLGISAPERM